MKITCTTDRKPWAGGKPMLKGETRDVTNDEAKLLIDAGFAHKGAPKQESDDNSD